MISKNRISILFSTLCIVMTAFVFYNQKKYANNENLEVAFHELMKGPYALPDDHPQLIEHIQRSLSPPSKKPYHLTYPMKEDPSMGQSMEIINIVGDMRDKGFFVECGAYDGEKESNTMLLERKYGWNGLLVEADPSIYDRLVNKHRKAWSMNACLSLKPYPNTVIFHTNQVFGKITNKALTSETDKLFAQVQCVPLYSILLALNATKVDFFSLDVEGFELDVLKTIPWDKVDIRVLSVEFINIKAGKNILGQYVESNRNNINAGKKALRQYMESIGYYVYKEAGAFFAGLRSDFIFHRKDIIPQKPAT